MSLIDRTEARRKSALAALNPVEQAALGQYFTPYQAALIIADLPPIPQIETIRVLDPGAGSGMLTAALVDRIRAEVMRKFLADLAWESEAWCASDPTHMIDLNGGKFVSPHEVSAS